MSVCFRKSMHAFLWLVFPAPKKVLKVRNQMWLTFTVQHSNAHTYAQKHLIAFANRACRFHQTPQLKLVLSSGVGVMIAISQVYRGNIQSMIQQTHSVPIANQISLEWRDRHLGGLRTGVYQTCLLEEISVFHFKVLQEFALWLKVTDHMKIAFLAEAFWWDEITLNFLIKKKQSSTHPGELNRWMGGSIENKGLHCTLLNYYYLFI